MTEPEFTKAVSSGDVDISADDSATSEPAGGAPLPFEQPVSLAQFLPILLQLQSTQAFLTAAPTFVPQTFQDQIQFVFDGTTYSLYLYFNNQWNGIALGSGASTSINALSNGSQSSVATGVDTQVQLQTNLFANGMTWDPVNYQFVVVTAGEYLITGRVNFASSVASGVFSAAIKINGSAIASDARAVSGNTAINSEVVTMAKLSVGDTVRLHAGQNSGFTVSLGAVYLGIAKV